MSKYYIIWLNYLGKVSWLLSTARRGSPFLNSRTLMSTHLLPLLQYLLLLLDFLSLFLVILVCFTMSSCWKSFSLCCFISAVIYSSLSCPPKFHKYVKKLFCLGTDTLQINVHKRYFKILGYNKFSVFCTQARIKPTCNKMRWHW